ncbi:hypothetical protein AVEN_103288-1 [Araneus ventricosus]|uniref:Uncharacterized protein n=1 Tax=Araneus ventricosus TaxID=182803 RepID=A0A4Y2STT1_ARAVE|nr:hypothetical protein AVEN_103288-1 [Araneus ventricosus]
MRGALNLKNNLVSIVPQLYVSPNQKMIPQVKFYRTSHRKKKKGSFLKNSSKKQRLGEFFDEPDNPIEQESDIKSFSVENSECAGFSSESRIRVVSSTYDQKERICIVVTNVKPQG